ncbi:hypothetical protein SUDANB1_02851 [Streptomyces sp. enrichment culture]
MSLCGTYRMPCGHNRSGTGREPGAFSGQGGRSGSISVQDPRPGSHTNPNGRIATPVTAYQDRSTRSCYEL